RHSPAVLTSAPTCLSVMSILRDEGADGAKAIVDRRDCATAASLEILKLSWSAFDAVSNNLVDSGLNGLDHIRLSTRIRFPLGLGAPPSDVLQQPAHAHRVYRRVKAFVDLGYRGFDLLGVVGHAAFLWRVAQRRATS